MVNLGFKICKNRDYKETVTTCTLPAHARTQQNATKTTAQPMIAWNKKTTNIYHLVINRKVDHDCKEMSPNCVKHKWNVVAALEHRTITSDLEIHCKQQ